MTLSQTRRSPLLVRALLGPALLSGALAACSPDATHPAVQPSPPATSSPAPSSPAPSSPAASRPAALSPVAMVGSQVYDDPGRHDSGVRDVATYVNTRGGLVVADRHGSVWLSRRGTKAVRIGHYEGSLHLVTDAVLRDVGWLTGAGAFRQVLHVVDTGTSRPVGTISLSVRARLVGIDGGSAYVVDHSPHLLRIDLASGKATTIPLSHPLDVEGVADGHLFVFAPFGSYLAPVGDLGQRQRVPLVDVISPSLRYGVGLEGDRVRDLVTRDRVPIHVPTGPNEKVSFYGWLGPTAVAFEKLDLQTHRWNLYSCDLVTAGCALAVSVPSEHLVGPGGWSPPAG